MKKQLAPFLGIFALAFTSCTTHLPLPAAEPNAVILDQYNAAGTATKKTVVSVAPGGVLATGTGGTIYVKPQADFLTSEVVASASAALTTAINGKQAANSALGKITESGGLPLWNGTVWPGGTGGGGSSPWTASGSNLFFNGGNIFIGGTSNYDGSKLQLISSATGVGDGILMAYPGLRVVKGYGSNGYLGVYYDTSHLYYSVGSYHNGNATVISGHSSGFIYFATTGTNYHSVVSSAGNWTFGGTSINSSYKVNAIGNINTTGTYFRSGTAIFQQPPPAADGKTYGVRNGVWSEAAGGSQLPVNIIDANGSNSSYTISSGGAYLVRWTTEYSADLIFTGGNYLALVAVVTGDEDITPGTGIRIDHGFDIYTPLDYTQAPDDGNPRGLKWFLVQHSNNMTEAANTAVVPLGGASLPINGNGVSITNPSERLLLVKSDGGDGSDGGAITIEAGRGSDDTGGEINLNAETVKINGTPFVAAAVPVFIATGTAALAPDRVIHFTKTSPASYWLPGWADTPTVAFINSSTASVLIKSHGDGNTLYTLPKGETVILRVDDYGESITVE